MSNDTLSVNLPKNAVNSSNSANLSVEPKINQNDPEKPIAKEINDTFEKQESPQKSVEKTEDTGAKNRLVNTCKTFVKTGEYLKATGSTVIFGGLVGGAIMFTNWLTKGWPKVFKKEINIRDMFNRPLKCVSKSSKIAAGIAFAAIGGFEFAKAYLSIKQKSTNLNNK